MAYSETKSEQTMNCETIVLIKTTIDKKINQTIAILLYGYLAMFNIPRNRFFLRLPDPSSSQALSAPDALSVLMLSYPLLCPTESSEI